MFTRSLSFLFLFVPLMIGYAASAQAVVFDYGVDIGQGRDIHFGFAQVPFIDGDETGFRLDTTDATTVNDMISFNFVTNPLPAALIVDSIEIFIDGNGLNGSEGGSVSVLSPDSLIGILSNKNLNAEVPIEGGGRFPATGHDPDDSDNTFLNIPLSYRSNIDNGSLGFKIVADPDSKYRIQAANLQISGHFPDPPTGGTAIPEPSTLVLSLIGISSALAVRRRKRL